MTNTKHTPGPWLWELTQTEHQWNRHGGYIDGNGSHKVPIAEICWQESSGTAKANARLIKKAPEMLSMLKQLAQFTDNTTPIYPGSLLDDDLHALLAEIEGTD